MRRDSAGDDFPAASAPCVRDCNRPAPQGNRRGAKVRAPRLLELETTAVEAGEPLKRGAHQKLRQWAEFLEHLKRGPLGELISATPSFIPPLNTKRAAPPNATRQDRPQRGQPVARTRDARQRPPLRACEPKHVANHGSNRANGAAMKYSNSCVCCVHGDSATATARSFKLKALKTR